MGYSTCFWHTVLNSKTLFDRDGWFANLQMKCDQPFPEPLKRAIITKNHPVLRTVIPSYYAQIKKAVDRSDLISINHRVAALLASYFDVLFALNTVLHPGEKKLLRWASNLCTKAQKTSGDRLKSFSNLRPWTLIYCCHSWTFSWMIWTAYWPRMGLTHPRLCRWIR